MSQERLTMRKIRQVLRLKWECSLSNRAIARSCSISHSTVSEYVRRAQEAGLSWPLPDDLDEERLFEMGVEPPDVARETGHSLKAVERYLQDYERVRMLLEQGMGAEEISSIIGRGRRVVLEYVELARQYHPELFPEAD